MKPDPITARKNVLMKQARRCKGKKRKEARAELERRWGIRLIKLDGKTLKREDGCP